MPKKMEDYERERREKLENQITETNTKIYNQVFSGKNKQQILDLINNPSTTPGTKEMAQKIYNDWDKKEEKKTNSDFAIMNEKLTAAEELYKKHPYFYDKKNDFWVWNKESCIYELADSTDLFNSINALFGYGYINTIESKQKGEIIEALKQIGRKKIPQDINRWWVQFNKQIVDIETGQTFEATPKYFFTTCINWDIGLSEETPKLYEYIKSWVVKHEAPVCQDESYIQTMFEIMAYSCLNNQFLQTIFVLTGSGSNGKSTFRNVLEKFVGKRNSYTSEMKNLTKGNFELSSLYKKAICFLGEIDAHDMQNTQRIKQLVGDEAIRFEFKNKTPFSDYSATKLMCLTNSLPKTPDQSPGFYRRWLSIDFPHVFPVGKDVLADIPDIEFNNLALKSIRLLKELKERKQFTNHGSTEERTKRYEARSNPVEQFVNQYCIIETPLTPIPTREFCDKVNQYLKQNNLRTLRNNDITKSLRDMSIRTGDKTVRENGEVFSLSGIWLSWKTESDIIIETQTKIL